MLQHWQLQHNPFTARSGEFFLSARHEEALSRLLFVVEQRRRCAVVTGGEQMGKSRLLTEVQRQVAETKLFSASIDATGLTAMEFSRSLVRTVPCVATNSAWDSLSDLLYGWQAIGQNSLWLIDHFDDAAEDLAPFLLRLIRLLNRTGAAGSVLIAARNLSHVKFRDGLDMIVALEPWNAAECREFIEQRLDAAQSRRRIFTTEAMAELAEKSGGVPGTLIRLCDLALQAGWTLSTDVIDGELVRSIAGELQPEPQARILVPQ